MNSPRYRIVIVDDHPLAMEALSQRVNDTTDMEVVCTAAETQTGLQLSLHHRPSLVVINIEVPGRGAFSLVEDLSSRLPSARVILWGDYFSDVVLDEALRLDVAGYLLANEPSERVIDAFRSVCQGNGT